MCASAMVSFFDEVENQPVARENIPETYKELGGEVMPASLVTLILGKSAE